MTNNEKMNEQIKDIAEAFKTMFTKEELEKLEKDFAEFQKRMLEGKDSSTTNEA
jgi:soluble cytochrome b562